MTLNETPSANRLHIAFYGRQNAGKSSLINALTGQQAAIVSPVAGTTADPVYKPMEVRGLGACVLIDTAGFDDVGELGSLRVDRTRSTLPKADIAVLVCSETEDFSLEQEWLQTLYAASVPVIAVLSQCDQRTDIASLQKKAETALGLPVLAVSAASREGIPNLLDALAKALPEGSERFITGNLVNPGDVVLLVMPQDSEAPKGRLILPQVQTIRELLDRGCIPVSVTPDRMDDAFIALKTPPALIITDSQAFDFVHRHTPKGCPLTSFSILFAAYKGDLSAYLAGAKALSRLTEDSRVLIAEACTHAPLAEDIGRVKIPTLLRKRYGAGLQIDIASGSDFPAELSGYQLIVHCGGCMFNRKYLLSRIALANAAGVPITNYGVLLAELNNILDGIALPDRKSVV